MKSHSSDSHIVYGINPAFEVVRAGRRKVLKAFAGERSASAPRLVKLLSLLAGRKVKTELTDRQVLFNICGSREHQGIVLQTEPYPLVPFSDMAEEDRMVLLDNIEDPGNLGAVLRSVEIFGWKSVLLPSKGTPGIYPSVVKASAGATEYLDIAADRTTASYVKELKNKGFVIVALYAGGKETLEQVAFRKIEKLLLVIGGEDKSVGQFVLNLADHVVCIRQSGKVSSLNASVAAGIALHALEL